MFTHKLLKTQQPLSTMHTMRVQNFARYLNRSEKMQQTYKYDPTAYEYRPNMIYNIDPAPQYPDDPMGPKSLYEWQRRRTVKLMQEKNRDNTMIRDKLRERYHHGRLFAHLKQQDMKDTVQSIKNKELGIDDEVNVASLRVEKGIQFDVPEVEDTFKLPYNVGFDHIIKQKTDILNQQKTLNFQAMNELVEKLGYMDYRDALACNKYILEAKRHGDYHQLARAQILGVAMAKFNFKKKEELEKSTQKHPLAATDKDQAKFETVLNLDPKLGNLYRDTYEKLKMDKEVDEIIAEDLYEKYDYLHDKGYQDLREVNDEFDPTAHDKEKYEDLFTTDMSDVETDLIYKRYKLMREQEKISLDDLRDQIKVLTMNMGQKKAIDPFRKDGSTIRSIEDYENIISKLYKQEDTKMRIQAKLEDFMSTIRFTHEMRKIQFDEVYNLKDPYFPGELPEDRFGQEDNINQPLEVRKALSINYQEDQILDRLVFDRDSGEAVEGYEEYIKQYFRAKYDAYIQSKLSQFRATNRDLENKLRVASEKDPMIQRRAEFMFNYMDYRNDRYRVREKFINEYNKKTTLQDIGQMLDKFIVEEKGEMFKYASPEYEDNLRYPKKDQSNLSMSLFGHILEGKSPLKPHLLDDKERLDTVPEGQDIRARDILERIKYEDSRTEHSFDTLTPDQRLEIQMFHSFKQDPYFKHYLYNNFRQFSEEMDDTFGSFPGPQTNNMLYDVPKFDRINLYDFRRALPQKERESKLDSKGCAWGFGKRKRSQAVVRVKPGKGIININGMSMLEYFHQAHQRYRILLPLTVTQYTCLLDIDIWTHGGGTTGQCEACVPAMAKAIQNYDVKTRPILKFFKLMRHDGRNVERKKPGLIKARKGQVYRRR